jgi:hypothetical protein
VIRTETNEVYVITGSREPDAYWCWTSDTVTQWGGNVTTTGATTMGTERTVFATGLHAEFSNGVTLDIRLALSQATSSSGYLGIIGYNYQVCHNGIHVWRWDANPGHAQYLHTHAGDGSVWGSTLMTTRTVLENVYDFISVIASERNGDRSRMGAVFAWWPAATVTGRGPLEVSRCGNLECLDRWGTGTIQPYEEARPEVTTYTVAA